MGKLSDTNNFEQVSLVVLAYLLIFNNENRTASVTLLIRFLWCSDVRFIRFCTFQWVYILDAVHQVLGWCGINTVDPAVTAEVVLRLALLLDASASLDVAHDGKSHKSGTVDVLIKFIS